MTKKIVSSIALVVVLFAILTLWGFTVYTQLANNTVTENTDYILHAEIVEVNEKNNAVLCESEDGNLWEFFGADDWNTGDFVLLLMTTKDLNNPEENEIVSVRLDPFAY